MKIIRHNRKGITLIELLLVLAILGIVAQIVYSIYFIGDKSFATSKDIGFAQQDARLVADYIMQELRTVKEVYIDLDEDTEVLDLGEDKTVPAEYYYLYLDNNNVLKRKHTNNTSKNMSIGSPILSLKFEEKPAELIEGILINYPKNIVVTVTSKERDKIKTYKVDITLENNDAKFVLPTEVDSVSKIYYTRNE